MDNKKERKVDNLINLVENHTRTERHLEQYAHIGDPKYKKMAIEKQGVREKQINSLKNQIIDDHKKISNEEQLENVKNSYEKTKNYLGNNFKNMSQEQITNMGNKEANQMRQIQRLEQNVDESGKYTL